MNFSFLALVGLIFWCGRGASIEVKCFFDEVDVDYDDYIDYGDDYDEPISEYQCSVQNNALITSRDNREISKVNGEHVLHRADEDVTQFFCAGSKVKFFPLKLTEKLRNLNSVTIQNAKLREITNTDLEQFGGRLRHLDLYDNDISFLSSDLFESNPHLEYFSIQFNQIQVIGFGTLSGLNDLTHLGFGNNPCFPFDDEGNEHSSVSAKVQRIETQCTKFDSVLNCLKTSGGNAMATKMPLFVLTCLILFSVAIL